MLGARGDRTVRRMTLTSPAFNGEMLAPQDSGYDTARRVWNAMIDRRPALIARCADTADVVAALAVARERGLAVAIRGGGHNVAGTAVADGALLVDLSAMRAVSVDPAARVVRVEGGATWADVDPETQRHGLAVPGGIVSMTGVAGLTLSGGVSSQRRAHGMTIDNLIAADVVLADGRQVRAVEGSDLLWALRGGGGNFGVVTAFEFRAHPLGPEVAQMMVGYPLERAGEIARAYRELVAGARDELTADLFVWSLPEDPALPAELHGLPYVGVTGMWAGEVDDGMRAFAPFRALGEPLLDMSGPAPYLDKQTALDPAFPDGMQHYWKSLYFDEVPDDALDAMMAAGVDRPSPHSIVVLRHVGGAIRRVPADSSAFGHRDAEFMLSIDASWTEPAASEENIAWARRCWDELQELSGGRMYFNFAGLLEDGDDVVRSSYGAGHERLREVKAAYDPENVFRFNANITPKGQ